MENSRKSITRPSSSLQSSPKLLAEYNMFVSRYCSPKKEREAEVVEEEPEKPIVFITETNNPPVFNESQPSRIDLNLDDITQHEIDEKIIPLILKQSQKSSANSIQGIIWGINRRLFVPLSLQTTDKTMQKSVIFCVEPNFPLTFVSPRVFKEIGLDIVERGTTNLIVHGKEMAVEQSYKKFRELNVLGADFLTFRGVRLVADYGRGKYTCCLEINNF